MYVDCYTSRTFFKSDSRTILSYGTLSSAVAVHEAQSRIPLVISGVHKQPRGVQSQVLTQHTDIPTTLLELVGLKADPESDGLSLVGHLRGGKRVVHWLEIYWGRLSILKRKPNWCGRRNNDCQH